MRSAAPLILKMSFKTPGKTNQGKNIGHLYYIANREGVEKNEEYSAVDIREDFEKTVDELVNSMEREESQSNNSEYLKYIDERPGSHGLFSENGPESIKHIHKILKEHEGIVWRGIISLHGDDADRLGFTNQKKWNEMLNCCIKDMTNQMGLKETNVQWAAAYHHEKGHPHVHFMLWEKEPQKTRGLVSEHTINNIKKDMVKEIFKDDRLLLFKEKTAMRDLIRDMSKEGVKDSVEVIREIAQLEEQKKLLHINKTHFAKPMYQEDQIELARQLKELANIMPGTGRVAFKYQSEEVKNKVMEITNSLLDKPQFSEFVRRYKDSTESITRHYSNNETEINKAIDNSMDDLKQRVAQIVLKGAVEGQSEKHLSNEDFNILSNSISNTVWKEVSKELEKEMRRTEAEANMRNKIVERKEMFKKKQQAREREI